MRTSLLLAVVGVLAAFEAGAQEPAAAVENTTPAPAPKEEQRFIEVEPLLPLEPIEPVAPSQETPISEVEPLAPEGETAPPVQAEPAVQGDLIVLDPGHGGADQGALGGGGLPEKQLTLLLCELLRARLEAAGLRVEATRTEDVDRSVKQRIDMANDQRGDLFLSIHASASPSERPHGVEIFYPAAPKGAATGRTRTLLGERVTNPSGESRAAAEVLVEQIRAQGPAELSGIRQVPLRIANSLAMPCVLVEVGYLTNATEESLLRTGDYRERLADALAAGIVAAMKGPAAAGGAS
ncbi:MAG: N-acetylmuramoyl-L-alanine amidase [Candidatus Hydrogenedentes bacterium]|nr:N-acetylmuramoyl-L-alanine amidase [Candidatus Hydrogenedentota bacterium]